MLSRSIARDRYQGTLLTQFFALLMTVNGIAPVLSPVLGGWIITAFDWRILFWAMAAIGVVLLLLSLTVLHETLPEKSAASVAQRQDETPVLKNRRFMRYCLIQAFMMAGLFSYIGSSSFVIQSEYAMSAMLPQPTLALVGLFFTVSMMSGISTVAGSEAMNAIHARQSGTASALMGTLMFVFGGIAATLAGLGGETMLKMSLAMTLCYLAALLIGLKKPRSVA